MNDNNKNQTTNKVKNNIILEKILIGTISTTIYVFLSVIMLKEQNWENDYGILIFVLSIFFFLIGLVGIAIPHQFYNFIYKVGKKMLSNSDHECLIEKPKERKHKYYTYSFLGLSYVLVIISILIILLNK